MNLFSTRVHGALDMLTVALLPTAPRALGWDARTTRFLDTAAAGVLAYSLLTRYEWGVVRVLPMRVHLLADAAFGASLLAFARARTKGEESGEPDRGTQAFLMGGCLFSLFAAVATDTEPSSSGAS